MVPAGRAGQKGVFSRAGPASLGELGAGPSEKKKKKKKKKKSGPVGRTP